MMKRIIQLLVLFLIVGVGSSASAQSSSNIARRIIKAASLPATCTVGDVYFKTAATVGAYQCLTTNNWTLFAAGGGSAPAGSGSELQARLNGTTLQALTDSSISGADLTLGGWLALSNGSQSTPSLFFTGDSDTGFFHIADNQLGFVGGPLGVPATGKANFTIRAERQDHLTGDFFRVESYDGGTLSSVPFRVQRDAGIIVNDYMTIGAGNLPPGQLSMLGIGNDIGDPTSTTIALSNSPVVDNDLIQAWQFVTISSARRAFTLSGSGRITFGQTDDGSAPSIKPSGTAIHFRTGLDDGFIPIAASELIGSTSSTGSISIKGTSASSPGFSIIELAVGDDANLVRIGGTTDDTAARLFIKQRSGGYTVLNVQDSAGNDRFQISSDLGLNLFPAASTSGVPDQQSGLVRLSSSHWNGSSSVLTNYFVQNQSYGGVANGALVFLNDTSVPVFALGTSGRGSGVSVGDNAAFSLYGQLSVKSLATTSPTLGLRKRTSQSANLFQILDTDDSAVKASIDASFNLAIAGTLSAGSGPTALTDVAGKIFSAALNTVAIANGGTSATDASGARTALGLAIGTNVQAFSARLSEVATIGSALQQIRVNAGGTALEYFTSSGGGGLTVGTTAIASGTTTRMLYDNAGVVGEAAGVTTDGTNLSLTGGSLTFTGNISAAGLFSTSGIRHKGVAATFNDTTSSGTVATAYTNVFGGNTLTATGATTITNYFTAYFNDPTASTNVTLTNKWAIGADSLKVGTSNPMTVSTSGVLSATTLALGTTPAVAGTLRLPNEVYITARNAANSGDVNMIKVDSSNQVSIGAGMVTSSYLNIGGSASVTIGNYFAISSGPRWGWGGIDGAFQLSNSGVNQTVIFYAKGATATPDLRFGGADAAAPVAQTLSVQSVVVGTSNTSGTSWTFNGSQGTGTGAGGSILFKTAPAGSTGTAVNALSTALTLAANLSATFPGVIINTGITSDAALTDTTVCQDTTSHQFYSGSGTLGICLGSSSLRAKENISAVDSSLATLMKLKPISFNYLPGRGFPTEKKYFGFGAEDVRPILPELAGLDAKGQPLSVDLLGMVPLLVRALQEQQGQLELLKHRLAILENSAH